MKTHAEIAKLLRGSIAHRKVSQSTLREQAGISQRTLTNVLSGQEDFKVSTLFALADRLGLELVLVGKEAAQAVSAGAVSQAIVLSQVQGALERSKASRRRRLDGEEP